jgi:hypothetical protein
MILEESEKETIKRKKKRLYMDGNWQVAKIFIRFS